jgi:hypothetical protein
MSTQARRFSGARGIAKFTETEQGEHAITHSGQMAEHLEDAVTPWRDLR